MRNAFVPQPTIVPGSIIRMVVAARREKEENHILEACLG
jgi:hypothetical protein